MSDYLALARVGITNPDTRPDGSGLDDGPPLPRWVVNGRKREQAAELWRAGGTLRAVADQVGVSHDTIRIWTNGMTRLR